MGIAESWQRIPKKGQTTKKALQARMAVARTAAKKTTPYN